MQTPLEPRASTTRRIARASVSEEPFHGRVTVHSPVESALFTISGTRDGFFLGFESSSATAAETRATFPDFFAGVGRHTAAVNLRCECRTEVRRPDPTKAVC